MRSVILCLVFAVYHLPICHAFEVSKSRLKIIPRRAIEFKTSATSSVVKAAPRLAITKLFLRSGGNNAASENDQIKRISPLKSAVYGSLGII